MKTALLFILVLALAGNTAAQCVTFVPSTKPIIANTIDTAGKLIYSHYSQRLLEIRSYDFSPSYFSLAGKRPAFHDTSITYWEETLLIHAGNQGVYTDTFNLEVFWDKSPAACIVKELLMAKVTSDTVLMLRPEFFQAEMNPNTDGSGWYGSATITLHNLIPYTSTFSNWRIMCADTSQDIDIRIISGSQEVTTIDVTRFDTTSKVTLLFHSTKGPLFWPKLQGATVLSTVTKNNKDTIIGIAAGLLYHHTETTKGIEADTISASFTNNVLDRTVKSFQLKKRKVVSHITFGRYGHPFEVQAVDNGTEIEVVVTAAPKSAGEYRDMLYCYYTYPDYFGHEQQDSFLILLANSVKANDLPKLWVRTSFPDYRVDYLSISNTGVLLAANSTLHAFYRSTDKGKQWIKHSYSTGNQNQLRGIFEHENMVFTLSYNLLMRSSNLGLTWTDISKILHDTADTERGTYYYSLPRIEELGMLSNGDLIASVYQSGYNGTVYPPVNEVLSIMSSSDFGDSWRFVRNTSDFVWIWPRPAMFAYVDSTGRMAAISHDGLYALNKGALRVRYSSHRILFSRDSGHTWQISTLLFDSIKSICVAKGESIYVANWNSGIYSTSDYGDNWFCQNGNLTTRQILQIVTNPGDHVYLGTEDDGVFRSAEVPAIAEQTEESVSAPTLKAIPSVSNGTVTLSFTNQEDSYTVSMFNIRGIHLHTFGKYSVSGSLLEVPLDLTAFPQGIYILTAKGEKASGSCMIIKY